MTFLITFKKTESDHPRTFMRDITTNDKELKGLLRFNGSWIAATLDISTVSKIETCLVLQFEEEDLAKLKAQTTRVLSVHEHTK